MIEHRLLESAAFPVAALLIATAGITIWARVLGRSWIACAAAAGWFAAILWRGMDGSRDHVAAVAIAPLAFLGVRSTAQFSWRGALLLVGVLSAAALLSDRPAFMAMHSVVALYALATTLCSTRHLIRRSALLFVCLALPHAWYAWPLDSRVERALDPVPDGSRTWNELPPATTVAALVMAFQLYAAHRLLSIARDHPDLLRQMHPSRQRNGWLRHADLWMAGLSGLFLAWYAVSVRDSGAWLAFNAVITLPQDRSYPSSLAQAAFLGPSLLLLVLMAPALIPASERKFEFRFLLGGHLLALLLALQAPPFAPLWDFWMPWSNSSQLCFLGLSGMFASLAGAHALEGLWSRAEIRTRGVLQTAGALLLALVASALAVDQAPACLPSTVVLFEAALCCTAFLLTPRFPILAVVPWVLSGFENLGA